MPKRVKQSSRTKVAEETADQSVGLPAQEDHGIVLPTKAQVSMLMAELGRKGGKIGGKRRLTTMTARERSIVATKAAEARWHKGRK